MLSIGKLAGGPDAGRYYEEAVAQGREDYYAGEGERPGTWCGGAAANLGLAGTVDDGQVGRLLAGEDPSTGRLLGRKVTEGGVAGFDLTFKAPKSVSVLFGIADAGIAGALRGCHDAAVMDAVAYLERHACQARRGKDGVVQVAGRGFVAAGFGHRSSRAGDPLLHTHVVVANRTLGPDGRWTALDARPLYREAKTAGYLYQARLRQEVTQRLGLEFGEVTKGSAELAGFSRELVERFSRRRAEIVEELDRRGESSLLAAQTAALATRQGKDYGVSIERLREQWRARAAEYGLDRGQVEELLAARRDERSAPQAVDLAALTEHASTFTRRDVLQAVAAARPDGASAAAIEADADALLQRPDVVGIAPPNQERRYTTRDQLQLERELLDGARDRRGAGAGVARADLVEAAIERRSLSEEQAELVRALTSSGRGVEVVRAPAGAGKTFALDAAREAWVRSGVEVMGCALSARAAAELREQAAIDTTTIARLQLALDHGYPLPPDGVLVVDEAGMVGTRDLARLARAAAERDAKLLLVGDDHQLPEIEAGGAFRALGQREGARELAEVRRHREPWDRDALSALRVGDVETWARAYDDRDRLVTAATAAALRERVADDWWQSHQRGEDAVMVALRRSDVADLNRRAHERLREAGRLRGEDVGLGDRSFAAGDRVALGRNDRALGVVNGDRGELLRVAEGHVDVRLDRGGDEVRLPATYATDGHLDHGYAITAHRAQGATVDRTFVLGSDELYREWGYTALSRHRDSATFYLTAPDPFLNRPAPTLDERRELADAVAATFADSRRQELALEAVERDPEAARALLALRSDEERLARLRNERDSLPWYRRAQRRDLDGLLEHGEPFRARARAHVEQLTERPPPESPPPPKRRGRRGREPFAHLRQPDHDLSRDLADTGLEL